MFSRVFQTKTNFESKKRHTTIKLMQYRVKLFSFFIILFIFEMHFKLIQNWLPFKTNELKQ